MKENKDHIYYAFISYKREDEAWAKWLQKKLESYKLPTYARSENKDIPERIRPVFRDTTDLTGGLLNQKLTEALTASKYLIVICSPRASQSKWVCRECETFIKLGRQDRIIPFIVDGEPHSVDLSRECFPQALLDLDKDNEPLGIKTGEVGKRKALVKTVSTLFGLRFDTLWDRYRRSMRRRRLIGGIAATAILAAAVASSVIISRKSAQNWRSESIILAKQAVEASNDGDYYLSRQIALSALPSNVSSPSGRKKVTPEAESALRNAWTRDGAIFRQREGDEIKMVALGPDGKTVASLSLQEFELRDLETGNVGLRVSLDTITLAMLSSIDFSPDGKRILTSGTSAFQLWDASSGEFQGILEGDVDCANMAVFSPDGSYILASSYSNNGGVAQLYDASSHGLLWEEQGLPIIVAISFSPDSGAYAIGCRNGTVRVHSTASRDTLHLLQGDDFMGSLSFSPDGKRMAAANDFGKVVIWDTFSGEERIRFEVQSKDESVNSMAFSPDGRWLALALDDGTIRLFDSYLGHEYDSLEGHTGRVNSVLFSRDGTLLISGSSDGTTRIFENPLIRKLDYLEGHDSSVCTVCFGPEGDDLYSFHTDGFISRWDLATESVIAESGMTYSFPSSVSFSPDGGSFVYSSWSHDVIQMDRDLNVVRKLSGHTNKIFYTAFTKDGKKIISISYDDIVKIWDAETGDLLEDWYWDGLVGGTTSPDGRFYAFCSSTDSVYVGNLDDGLINYSFKGSGGTLPVAFSPDGNILVSWRWVMDSATGKKIAELEGDFEDLYSVSFSRDGSRIVGGADRSVLVWDTHSGRIIARFDGHQGLVWDAAFSPDGKTIVSGSGDFRIGLWSYESLQSLIDRTRELFSPDNG